MNAFFTLLAWLLQATAKGSTGIVLMAVAASLIGRRVRARWRHALWLLIALRLLVPIAPPSFWSVFNFVPPHPGIQLQLRGAPAQVLFTGTRESGIDIPIWIANWKALASFWLLGFLAVCARTLLATLRMRRFVRLSHPVSDPAVDAIVEEGKRRLKIRRSVRVVESPAVAAPSLHGTWSPVLLLPENFAGAFDADELRHVIFHELCHVRRHDIAWNWMVTLVQAVHWFNPLVWFAAAQIEEERELACDEATLSCFERDERFHYGRTILKLLERFRTVESVPAVVGIINAKQKVKRRLVIIGAADARSRFTTALMAVLMIVCLMAFTDARGVMESPVFDPSGLTTLGRFNTRVSMDLRDASTRELLDALARVTGVAIAPPAIDDRIRFTVHADNVPASAIAIDAFGPLRLMPLPSGDRIVFERAPACISNAYRDPPNAHLTISRR